LRASRPMIAACVGSLYCCSFWSQGSFCFFLLFGEMWAIQVASLVLRPGHIHVSLQKNTRLIANLFQTLNFYGHFTIFSPSISSLETSFAIGWKCFVTDFGCCGRYMHLELTLGHVYSWGYKPLRHRLPHSCQMVGTIAAEKILTPHWSQSIWTLKAWLDLCGQCFRVTSLGTLFNFPGTFQRIRMCVDGSFARVFSLVLIAPRVFNGIIFLLVYVIVHGRFCARQKLGKLVYYTP